MLDVLRLLHLLRLLARHHPLLFDLPDDAVGVRHRHPLGPRLGQFLPNQTLESAGTVGLVIPQLTQLQRSKTSKHSSLTLVETYLRLVVLLRLGVFGGVGGDQRARVLDHFAIFQDHLALHSGLDLLGVGHFGLLLAHPFLCWCVRKSD
jgi:hypothetical protein